MVTRQRRVRVGRDPRRRRVVADAADRGVHGSTSAAGQAAAGVRHATAPAPTCHPPPRSRRRRRSGEQTDADLRARNGQRQPPTADAARPGAARVAGVDVRAYVGVPLAADRLAARSIVLAQGLAALAAGVAPAPPRPAFVGAWRELVDHARDLGQVVPVAASLTRREQSSAVDSPAGGGTGPPRRQLTSSGRPCRSPTRRARPTGGRSTTSAGRCRPRWAGGGGGGPRSAWRRSAAGTRASPDAARRRRGAPARLGISRPPPTKLACRPNVGCVSWCLAAARITSCPSRQGRVRRVRGMRTMDRLHEVHRSRLARAGGSRAGR